mmetsp:Transcript_53/g.155  ORF Transcript_53/g.155 Transcript_53/m.155 type:complete len:167 (+) Transcript_53:152-652(+)|eukprot:CAMPEP_0198722428 /NCGR_PEP_ID=MMETSP1475-20131203/165_1 /TAXON_ID= ORGANISM="Unidentified sp., Strain CCMP1999" /NCGR_SAMPLE_ID=MMETSP1475 /ASSEMBLY_ACC=CAM_ASM_001111 /LENGTH=166 /DNA_ID=CAMNT_0044483333 /DNA_START=99 /DNA_END=599 /DNA_ORIENTATION=+
MDAPQEYPPVDCDLLEHFGLRSVLDNLRQRKLRSTFNNYIADISGEETPINAKCYAGSLVEVALQPAAEDERNFETFDERSLRMALVLSEDKEPVPQPKWLQMDQPWDDDDKKRRKKHKKKKKRKKREGDGGDNGEDSDRRKHKKRRRDTDNLDDTEGETMAQDLT